MTLSREELRAGIFKGVTLKRKDIKFNGADLQLIQPTVGQVLSLSSITDSKQRIVKALVEYCVIPGTETRVFEDTDFDSLMAMPWTQDHVKIQESLTELMVGDTTVADAAKNSEATA